MSFFRATNYYLLLALRYTSRRKTVQGMARIFSHFVRSLPVTSAANCLIVVALSNEQMFLEMLRDFLPSFIFFFSFLNFWSKIVQYALWNKTVCAADYARK